MKTEVIYSGAQCNVRFDAIPHRGFFRYGGNVYWKVGSPHAGDRYRAVCIGDARVCYFMDDDHVTPIDGPFSVTIKQTP